MLLTRFFTVFALCGLAFPILAQNDADMAALNSAIETQRQITEAQRTMIVTDNTLLTAAESEEFWPLYREYRGEVAKLNDRFVKLIRLYGANYETLKDDEAMQLLKDSFRIESDRIKLTQRYSTKFNKIIPGTKVMRFLQIEARLDAILELKVRHSIPLVM